MLIMLFLMIINKKSNNIKQQQNYFLKIRKKPLNIKIYQMVLKMIFNVNLYKLKSLKINKIFPKKHFFRQFLHLRQIKKIITMII